MSPVLALAVAVVAFGFGIVRLVCGHRESSEALRWGAGGLLIAVIVTGIDALIAIGRGALFDIRSVLFCGSLALIWCAQFLAAWRAPAWLSFGRKSPPPTVQ